MKSNDEKQMAAIIFCRVSTAKQQQRNEANLPAQEKRCQDWCKSNDLSVLKVFVAEGESAWDTTRPVFEEALHFAQQNKGRVSHFVVQDVSRFSRNMETQGIAMARLKKLGVTLVSCDEPSIDRSPVGMLMATILGGMAEFYSHSLSSRVRYRFQVHREQGHWLHMAPIGYKNVKQDGIKTIVPDEAAPLVRQCFEMMSGGGYSSDSVRAFITAAGLRTKKGHKLTRQTFSFMLKSPVYCGLIVHKGKVYKGSFTALVSEELWQSVQDSLHGRKKAVPKKTADDTFPLRGFVKCGHCRAKLTAGNAKGRSKTYPRYWCWNRECSKPVSVDRAKLEADWLGFLEHMQPAFDALVNVLPVLAKSNTQKRIQRVDQRQRHLATQLSEKKALHLKLIEAKLRGELKQEDFETMRDALAKDVAEIESAHRALIQDAEVALQLTSDTTRQSIPAKALWASAHLTDRLTVQSALFPEGILYRTDIGFFEPPDDGLQAVVFRMLVELAEHPEAYIEEEIKSGRGDWI